MADDTDGDLELHRQGAARVLAVRLPDGSVPALEFLETYPRSKAKFRAPFERLLTQGKITNSERFHKVESAGTPAVFEVKVHDGKGLRLYMIQDGADWYATHGRTKPSDKKVDAEANKAREIYKQRRAKS
jgi:putative component of toxin-antitoxin plasmid stabilization module